LIGRGSYGNPWVFKDIRESIKEQNDMRQIESGILRKSSEEPEEKRKKFLMKLDVLLEHARLHYKYKGESGFVQMRKHFGWYIKGFEGASKYRIDLMTTDTLPEVEEIVERIRHSEDI
jgi:tRNA-dihydrouridine synthase B